MKRSKYLLEKLRLTTAEERREERAHQIKESLILLAACAVVAVACCYIWQTYWNAIPHCVDGINAARVCK